MRSIHGLVILAEELSALLFGQVSQNDLGITRILVMDQLGRHGVSLRPGHRMSGHPAETACPGYPKQPCRRLRAGSATAVLAAISHI
jgi:hypothetical protein